MYLRIDRILSVKTISLKSITPKINSIRVEYKLKNSNGNYELISEIITNKFQFFQKVLSYGNDCIIISPKEIKNQVVEKLNNILKIYCDNESSHAEN